MDPVSTKSVDQQIPPPAPWPPKQGVEGTVKWPTNDELEAAKAQDLAKGTPNEQALPPSPTKKTGKIDKTGEVITDPRTGEVYELATEREAPAAFMRRTTKEEVKYASNNATGDYGGELSPLTKEEHSEIYKTFIASKRSPLASLGYDLSQTAMTNRAGLNVWGLTSNKTGQMWFDMRSPSTPVHESIHRGMKELREKAPDELSKIFQETQKKYGREMARAGTDIDELLTRALVAHHYGDIERVEEGRFTLAGKKDEAALQMQLGRYMAETNPEILLKLEALADRVAKEKK